jgi:predicted lipoprotein
MSSKITVLRWGISLAVLGILCWQFPLFHVVSLKQARREKQAEVFDAGKFAKTFWLKKLLPAASKAVDAKLLLAAIQSGPAAAKSKYARTVGLSDSYLYFLRGDARIVAASDDEISLAVTKGATNAEIVMEIGPVFGNAVRDGTGLLNPSDYPNSQDFNAISSALNHLVETRVLPKLRDAKAGMSVRFAGCAEVDDESTDLHPLHVTPIVVEFLTGGNGGNGDEK